MSNEKKIFQMYDKKYEKVSKYFEKMIGECESPAEAFATLLFISHKLSCSARTGLDQAKINGYELDDGYKKAVEYVASHDVFDVLPTFIGSKKNEKNRNSVHSIN